MEKKIKEYLENKTVSQMIDDKRIPGKYLVSVMKLADKSLLSDKDIKRVEIIVLKYKSPEMEQDCISRIIQYTQWPYKLNVFDNRGNGPNTSKVWNKLIKESTCDYVMFIDSDAFVTDSVGRVNGERIEGGVCWLTEMMKVFTIFDDVAIVGPVCGTNATTTIQSMSPKDDEPFTLNGHISGYCFLTPKSIYHDIGYFDEDFNFYGQESDWIERVLEKNHHDNGNYKIIVVPRAHVLHGYADGGSQAGKKAEEDKEFNLGHEASYSYYLWHLKKQQRLESLGINYEFDEQ